MGPAGSSAGQGLEDRKERLMEDETELQDRLLSELEEAGEENLPTLANTIFAEEMTVDQQRAGIRSALAGLINADLVRVAFEDATGRELREISKELSERVIEQLDDHLVLRSDGTWTGGPRPWPEVVTTEKGKARARVVLETRGYQWWRQ